jgi:hypothetical protein
MAAPASRAGWLWILVIAVLAILLLAWLLDPSGEADDAENMTDAAAPADGYVAAPTDPAVPVVLPTAAPSVGEPALSPTPLPAVTPTPEQ